MGGMSKTGREQNRVKAKQRGRWGYNCGIQILADNTTNEKGATCVHLYII